MRCSRLLTLRRCTPMLASNSWRPAVIEERDDRLKDFSSDHDPLPYRFLGLQPGAPMRDVKIRFLLYARKYHPAVKGGDAELFLRCSLAYQDVLKDYGIETVDGQIVNLGNFQVCASTAEDYLKLRAQIKEDIPVSTLEDHIAQLEPVEQKLLEAQQLAFEAYEAEQRLLAAKSETTEEATKATEEATAKSIPTSSWWDFVSKKETASRQPPLAEGPKAIIPEEVLTKEELEIYERKEDVEYRNDVAGIAARTATQWMEEAGDYHKFRFHLISAIGVWMGLLGAAFGVSESLNRRRRKGRVNAEGQHDVDGETPWYGNEHEYEAQTKRLFVEEWMKARRSARRVQTYQEGVSREEMDLTQKSSMDKDVFEVSPGRLKEMRDHAIAQKGRY